MHRPVRSTRPVTRRAGPRARRPALYGGRTLLLVAALGLLAASCGGTADEPGATTGGLLDGSQESTTDPADAAEGEGSGDADATTDARHAEDAPDGSDAPDVPDAEAVLRVVTTVAPVADLIGEVGSDRVEVTSLVPGGADAHTYEPRPQDVVALSEADAYLGIGLGLNDTALTLASENLPDGAVTVLLGERGLEDADLVFDHTHDDGAADHSHDADADHTHDDGETDEGDEPAAGPNPHIWTSLRNARALVGAIADALGELDPDGAASYATNAADVQARFDDLDTRVADAAATIPGDNRTLVSYHDAWAYFARDYGLEYASAVQPADFTEPSAQEVRAVIDLIRELDVPVVFGSEVFPTPVLETIAEETGATYVANLADDVLPGSPGDPEHTYLEMMRRNAHAIIDGLGGDADLLLD